VRLPRAVTEDQHCDVCQSDYFNNVKGNFIRRNQSMDLTIGCLPLCSALRYICMQVTPLDFFQDVNALVSNNYASARSFWEKSSKCSKLTLLGIKYAAQNRTRLDGRLSGNLAVECHHQLFERRV
jgi:hypothetical protein